MGRASWAEGLQQGLQEVDVTQEMPPGGKGKHPRCLAVGRAQEQRALGSHVGSPAESGAEPWEGAVGLSGRTEAARKRVGCFGGTDRHSGG